MLQIRLSKPSNEDGGGAKPSPADTVRAACPDHLVLADLPVAKSLLHLSGVLVGGPSGNLAREFILVSVVISQLLSMGVWYIDKFMFSQSPCEHVFCLDCARSGCLCYLCDVQKIQTIKFMEGIFICPAPHCLKSFLKKTDFESHIHETHAELLHNTEKDGHESEAVNARKPTASDSTVQAPPRPLISPSSNHQAHDYRPQPRDQQPPWPAMQSKPPPPFIGQIQSNPLEQQGDSIPSPGFDRFGSQNRFTRHSFDPQSGPQQPGQVPERQQGIISEPSFIEYPMHPQQPANFAVPINPNPVLVPTQFGYPPFAPDGSQPFYGAPYEIPWPATSPAGQGQGTVDGIMKASDSQETAFLQGDYGRPNQGMERGQGGITMDPRDGKAIWAPQPLPLPPPPPLPPHLSQLKRNN